VSTTEPVATGTEVESSFGGTIRVQGTLRKTRCKHCRRPIFTLSDDGGTDYGWYHFEERRRFSDGKTYIKSTGSRCPTMHAEPEEAPL
jgi:hypothetical protein